MRGAGWSPLFLFCAVVCLQAEPLTRPEAVAAYGQVEELLHRAMMVGDSGAVRVNAVNDRPVVAGEARNSDCLSEAAGQLMELALIRNDATEFARQFRLVRHVFQGKTSPFLAWKVSSPDMRQADTSATLDDWRVVWACREAARRWQVPEYADFGKELAAAIAKKSQELPLPPPAFNLGDGSPGSGMVPLCYLHLLAMESVQDEVPGVREFLERAETVLSDFSAAPGMVPQYWNPATGKYSEGASDEVTALITLLALQATGPDRDLVETAIRTRLAYFKAQGGLPQAFDSRSGAALPVPAGASVYALFARLLMGAGQRDDAAVMLAKMREFQNPPGHEFAGAIGGRPVYSFDQLEALLALAEFLRSGPEASPDLSPDA